MDLLALGGEPAGADDFFPIFVFVILRANPPYILSTIQVVSLPFRFIEPLAYPVSFLVAVYQLLWRQGNLFRRGELLVDAVLHRRLFYPVHRRSGAQQSCKERRPRQDVDSRTGGARD